MRRRILACLLSAAIVFTAIPVQGTLLLAKEPEKMEQIEAEEGREKLNFNQGWKFVRRNIPEATEVDYPMEELERWENVDLPHSVRTEPYINSGGENYQGPAMYRKHFYLSESYAQKKLYIEFEAVMGVTDVWVNGVHLQGHMAEKTGDNTQYGGYLPFVLDITDYVHCDGEKNVITVLTDNSDNETVPPGKPQGQLDFTYFGGIYRNVWLHSVNKVHITDELYEDEVAGGGILVDYPEVSKEEATVDVQTHIRNEEDEAQEVILETEIQDKEGEVVAEGTQSVELEAGAAEHVEQILQITDPNLWSLDDPYMHTLVSKVYVDGVETDCVETEIGIRKITMDTENGLLINGEHPGFLSGVNRHQEYPYIGYAASSALQRSDAVRYKEAGFNIVRTAHHPQSEDFLEACDELGILVMESIPGWQHWSSAPEFAQRVKNDTRQIIRRDRNHPCILTFEISLNESPGVPAGFTNEVESIAKEEHPSVKTSAENPHEGAAGDILYGTPDEVASWSDTALSLIREYGDFWEEQFGNFGNDCRVTRGTDTFYPGGEARMVSQANNRLWKGYSFEGTGSISLAEGIQNYIDSGHRFAGVTMWIGIDHNRGYHSTMSPCGIWDLRGIPKYAYYAFASQRPAEKDDYLESMGVESGPMLFVASSWSEKAPVYDKSGGEMLGTDEERIIYVYSNADTVKLSVVGEDGTTLWEQTNEPITDELAQNLDHPPFYFENVPYTAGSHLVAEGYDTNGNVIASQEVHTAGEPAKIKLEVDDTRTALTADGSDKIMVYATILDENGNVCQDADNSIRFSVEGEGNIVGDGDQRVGSNPVAAEAGKTGVYIESTKTAGEIRILAASEGLESAEIVIESEELKDKIVPYEEIAQGTPIEQSSMYLSEKEESIPGENADAAAITRGTVSVDGTDYQNSMKVRNMAPVEFDLQGAYQRLTGSIAVENPDATDGVIFKVFGDGALLYESSAIKDEVQAIDINVSNVQTLKLCAEDENGINDVTPIWLSLYVTEGTRNPDESELRENLALGKSVEVTSADEGTSAAEAVDGDILTLWRSAQRVTDGHTESLIVDLGETCSIRNTRIAVEHDYLRCTYDIYTSADKVEWTKQATGTKTAHGNEDLDLFTAANVRYVKVEFTNVESTQGETGGGERKASVKELEIYKDKGVDTVVDYNLAGLSVAGKDLVFDAADTSYEVALEGYEDALYVKAYPANERSSVYINGEYLNTQVADSMTGLSYVKTEPNESGQVIVEVVSPDEQGRKQYVIQTVPNSEETIFDPMDAVVEGVNGAYQWKYQTRNVSTGVFEDMGMDGYVQGQYAWNGGSWLYSGPVYMHPAADKDAVRTFVVSEEGILDVHISAEKYVNQPGQVALSVMKNGQKIWPEDGDKKILNSGETLTAEHTEYVKAGDEIQIVLSAQGDNGGDATFVDSWMQYQGETTFTETVIEGKDILSGAYGDVLAGDYQLNAKTEDGMWVQDISCDWKLKEETEGVSVDENGTVQVQADIEEGTFTLQAYRDGELLAEKEVQIQRGDITYLSDLEWESAEAGDGTVNKDRSHLGEQIRLTGEDQNPVAFEKGIGTHAQSRIVYDIAGKGYDRFQSYIGIDYSQNQEGYYSNVVFKVYFNNEDTEPVYDSGQMVYNTPMKKVDLALDDSVEKLILVVEQGENNWSDHANWADAKLLKEKEVIVTDISTDILEYALGLAADASTEGVIDTVAQKFEETYSHALDLLARVQEGDSTVTQEMVDDSWKELIQMMQYLSFKQGDKTDLEKVVVMAESLDLSKYLETGKAAFTESLEQAKIVLQNGDAMQDEVNEAWKTLLKAMSELKRIPDKSALEELLKETENLRAADYEAESYQAFSTAYAAAMEVFQDDMADEEAVNTAKTNLLAAVDNLKPVSEKQTETEESDVKAEDQTTVSSKEMKDDLSASAQADGAAEDGEKTADTQKVSQEKSVKTGDETWMYGYAATALAMLTVLVVRKKKMSAKATK